MNGIITKEALRPSLDNGQIQVQDIMPKNEGFDYSRNVLEVPKGLQTIRDVESSVHDVPASFWKRMKPVLHYCRTDLLDGCLCRDAVKSDTRNLEYVPPKLFDKEMYSAALERDGNLLCRVPEELVDRELCMIAVKSRPMSLGYVPEGLIDEELCETALYRLSEVLSEDLGPTTRAQIEDEFLQSFRSIPRDVLDHKICELAAELLPSTIADMPGDIVDDNICLTAIESPRFPEECETFLGGIPKRLLNDRIIDRALDSSGMCLASLDGRRRTRTRCERAVRSCPQALRYVPPRHVTPELCHVALQANPGILHLIPEDMLTADMCKIAVTHNWRSVRHVPNDLLNDGMYLEVLEGALVDHSLGNSRDKRSIVQDILGARRCFRPSALSDHRVRFLERRLGLRQLASCAFDASEERFIIRERVLDDDGGAHFYEDVTRKRGLKALSEYLIADLDKASLDGYELSREERAAFPDLVSGELWEAAANGISSTEFRDESTGEQLPELLTCTTLSRNDIAVFYVTDIHLRHRILARFPNGATNHEVKAHVKHLAHYLAEMRDEVASYSGPSVLLVGGDTSDSPVLSRLFFIELAKVWDPKRIYVVLGNHELWSAPDELEGERAVDSVVNTYRKLLSELGMTLVHNELVMRVPGQDDIVYGADAIMDTSMATSLLDAADGANLLLFGGIGFSTLSPHFNFRSGIYRHAIRSAEQEAKQSVKVDELHHRLIELFGRRSVVFLTHTPIWDWSKEVPHRCWSYVSGHTHKNGIDVWERGGHYHDAQVAYDMDGMLLRHFSTPGRRDVFWRYGDGVYRICHGQYREFNLGAGIHCDFNRQGEVLLLKRSGYYLFLLRDDSGTHRLEGGAIRKMGSWSVGSMYDALDLYAEASKAIFSGYQAALRRIGDAIRSFGGHGTVHGSIVDVDFYSHIYVDPLGEGIRYYFATSPSPADRVEYRDMRSLLRDRKPELLPAYDRRSLEYGEAFDVMAESTSMVQQLDEALVKTTYARSRVTRSFQYLFDANVVRTWNEGILEALSEIVRGSGPNDTTASASLLDRQPKRITLPHALGHQ